MEFRIRNSISRVKQFVGGSDRALESMRKLHDSERIHQSEEERRDNHISRRKNASLEGYTEADATNMNQATLPDKISGDSATPRLDRGCLFGSHYKVPGVVPIGING
jgi:hypothetical protein